MFYLPTLGRSGALQVSVLPEFLAIRRGFALPASELEVCVRRFSLPASRCTAAAVRPTPSASYQFHRRSTGMRVLPRRVCRHCSNGVRLFLQIGSLGSLARGIVQSSSPAQLTQNDPNTSVPSVMQACRKHTVPAAPRARSTPPPACVPANTVDTR